MAVAALALIFLCDALPQSQVDNVLVPGSREVSAKISRQYQGGTAIDTVTPAPRAVRTLKFSSNEIAPLLQDSIFLLQRSMYGK